MKKIIETLLATWCRLLHTGAINYDLFRMTYQCPTCQRRIKA